MKRPVLISDNVALFVAEGSPLAKARKIFIREYILTIAPTKQREKALAKYSSLLRMQDAHWQDLELELLAMELRSVLERAGLYEDED